MSLTDLQINQRMAALSGYEIVEGHDPDVCYVETRLTNDERPHILVYDVLNCNDMTLQAIKANRLNVTWDMNTVAVTLPPHLKPNDFRTVQHAEGDISRAVCMLLLNAIGNDK